MAMCWEGLLVATAILLFVSDCSCLNINVENGSAAMVLPLILSPPRANSSVIRRLAAGKPELPSARMKLYDDLLTNGYYTTRLRIGTPPQEFALIVDSGSTVTYVPCSTCTQCGNHQDPRFQPDLSSTYQPVKCGIDCSNCDIEKNQCKYERQYAEMSSSSGVLGEDIVSFGDESALKPQRAVFGCENSETGDIYHQHADGIMGLGRGTLSVMDQLVQTGVIANSFSLCYGGMGIGGGAMILGAIPPPPEMVFTKSNPNRSPYYNIQLKGMRVAGTSLPLNPQVFDGKYGTVVDSGTTYAYLPEAAFVAFRDAVIKHLGSLKRIDGPDPTYHDICFSGAGSDISQLNRKFPRVDLVFEKGQMVSLAPENYLFQHSKVHGAYCLGIFQNGKDPTTLLGGILVRNMLVTYDRSHERIGFWKTNCSELWQRLQSPTAPPLPAAPPLPGTPNSQDKNVSVSGPILPPAPAPSEPNPGQNQEIGGLELFMSMTTGSKDFILVLPKFKEDMARELEIASYQVHILNFSSEGDGVKIRWTVSPADSSNQISNDTAKRIISLLTEHKVHLRDAFGTYNLLSWKVLPPSERSWLQRHGLALLGGSIGVTLIASSSVIYWYWWRQKQEVFGNYKTVDAINQEEELQQL
ncbi:aspartic proteinase nepenthesin-1 [Cryptomeria japonica]|uniref:aspartic proteinase nepenthesin-1 n=1 Tax=Cryptomeria japonica TaxID=3369 RepID=UPI0027DA176E|nr:aspartic proteinase nepenthesin-1 [Cryptomeria japonica]